MEDQPGGPPEGCGRLILGTAQLTRSYGVAARSRALPPGAAVRLLQHAARCGIGGIDTAPAYGDAEATIGASGVRTPVFTKVGPGDDPETSLRSSLSALGREAVDILFLHDPEVLRTPGRPVVRRAFALVGHGAGTLGVSVYTPAEFEACLEDERIGAVQAPVSVADRRLAAAGLLAEATAHRCAVFARSVFLQGALLMAADALPPFLSPLRAVTTRLTELSATFAIPVAAILTRYVRDLPPVAGVVLGCESEEQFDEDCQAMSGPGLPAGLVDAIESLPALPDRVTDPRAWG